MDEHVNFIPKSTGAPVRLLDEWSHGGGVHGRVTEVSWEGKSTPNAFHTTHGMGTSERNSSRTVTKSLQVTGWCVPWKMNTHSQKLLPKLLMRHTAGSHPVTGVARLRLFRVEVASVTKLN